MKYAHRIEPDVVAALLKDASAASVVTLWHVTTEGAAEKIAVEGVRGNSYWTCDEGLVAYYEAAVRDEGGEPVVLETTLAAVPPAARLADRPGYDEPITTVLGREDDLRARHDELLAGTGLPWLASLVALGSLRCAEPLPAAAIGRRERAVPAP